MGGNPICDDDMLIPNTTVSLYCDGMWIDSEEAKEQSLSSFPSDPNLLGAECETIEHNLSIPSGDPFQEKALAGLLQVVCFTEGVGIANTAAETVHESGIPQTKFLASEDSLTRQSDNHSNSDQSPALESGQMPEHLPPAQHKGETSSQNAGGDSDADNHFTCNDVLFGRTKLARSHPGNKAFRQLIQSFRDQYQATKSRNEKRRIIDRIVDIVQERGDRFLIFEVGSDGSESNGFWTEASRALARDKVSHALRHRQNQYPREEKGSFGSKQLPTKSKNAMDDSASYARKITAPSMQRFHAFPPKTLFKPPQP